MFLRRFRDVWGVFGVDMNAEGKLMFWRRFRDVMELGGVYGDFDSY